MTINSSITHNFLTLRQPMDCTRYPKAKTFQRGVVYRFPFLFVVPDRLLPSSCTHPKCSWSLQQAHTSLPPTMRDQVHTCCNSRPLDDLTPSTTKIVYLLTATIANKSANRTETIASVGKKIRITPTVTEDPPLSISDDSTVYRTKTDITVRQGLRRSECGQLTLSAIQPRPIQVQLAANGLSSHTIGTMATLNLRFTPAGDDEPPQLITLSSKLKALTFQAIEPQTQFPTNSPMLDHSKINRRTCQRTIPLLSFGVSSVRWDKHDTSSRDGNCRGKLYYTASIIIPTTLPSGKTFVPTFHSCFVSRVYVLKLAISYISHNRFRKTASIKIPVQITCGKGN